jgi:hypothetical protein
MVLQKANSLLKLIHPKLLNRDLVVNNLELFDYMDSKSSLGLIYAFASW